MTRYSKKNGKYHVSGSKYHMLTGTRAQVWHGTALKTSGGLKKSDLFKNKAGRIVSKSKHASAKRENRLVKNGYGTKKGQFGFVKLGTMRRRGSKKMRGGYSSPYGPLDGEPVPGSDQMGSGVYTPRYDSMGRAHVGGKRKGTKRRRRH